MALSNVRSSALPGLSTDSVTPADFPPEAPEFVRELGRETALLRGARRKAVDSEAAPTQEAEVSRPDATADDADAPLRRDVSLFVIPPAFALSAAGETPVLAVLTASSAPAGPALVDLEETRPQPTAGSAAPLAESAGKGSAAPGVSAGDGDAQLELAAGEESGNEPDGTMERSAPRLLAGGVLRPEHDGAAPVSSSASPLPPPPPPAGAPLPATTVAREAAPPSQLPEDRATLPVPLARLGEALHSSIQHSLRLHSAGERWSLELRLDPPELGAIRVVLELEHNSLRGAVHFTDPQLEQVLERTLPALESALRENGGNAFLDLRRDRGGENAPAGRAPEDRAGREEPARPGEVLQSDHLIDVTA